MSTELQSLKTDDLLAIWQDELSQNPHFSDDAGIQTDRVVQARKPFLDKMLHTLNSGQIPSISKTDVEPMLKIWHDILKDHRQTGMTLKDTAMLIFSLKSSLSQVDDKTSLSPLESVLDVLGLLTFEMYAQQSEQTTSRQASQLAYVQHETLKHHPNILISQSPIMQDVYKAIGLILDNDMTVLLEGESGTGKDVLANLIHFNSKRCDKPFVTLNCGAIPKDLIESELFGHEKGAFTGADTKRLGKFELAHGGTLFLDEIGELDLSLQVKLLRALQNKKIERLGSTQSVDVDVRFIAATNQNLSEAVANKTFRLDLFYRLNVYPIQVPALRDRREDIVPLAHYFIERYASEFGLSQKALTDGAVAYLQHAAFNGNIRELENLMQRALILSPEDSISETVLANRPGQRLPGLPDPTIASTSTGIRPLSEVEKDAISAALHHTNGNIKRAADALGITRTTLYNKARKYNLNLKEIS